MKRKMTFAAGPGVLLLVGVAFGDSIPATCPECDPITSTVKAHYLCPDVGHPFSVYPAWEDSEWSFPPPTHWHCPVCDVYGCVSLYCECMATGCDWEWRGQ